MKLKRWGAAFLLAMLLFAMLYTPVLANTIDVTAKGALAAEWLKQAVPQPDIGDEDVVLALLRGGYVTSTQEYTQGYLRKLAQHIGSEKAAGQSVQQSAKQGMVLLAAGVSIHKNVPQLMAYYNDRNAIDAGGPEAQVAILLLYASAPQEFKDQIKLDINALAADFAATHHVESGFGTPEPDVISTALAIQALAAYQSVPGVEDALLYGQMYLQLHTNDIGGFNIDGQPSALAVAEVMLAMACLSEDPTLLTPDSAPLVDALAVFQNQDGSFAANPDASPDPTLTAKGLLAYMAKQRFDRNSTPVYSFTDAQPTEITEAPSSPGGSQPASGGNNSTGGNAPAIGKALSPLWVAGILAATLAVITLIAIIVARKNKKYAGAQGRKPTPAKPTRRGTAEKGAVKPPPRPATRQTSAPIRQVPAATRQATPTAGVAKPAPPKSAPQATPPPTPATPKQGSAPTRQATPTTSAAKPMPPKRTPRTTPPPAPAMPKQGPAPTRQATSTTSTAKPAPPKSAPPFKSSGDKYIYKKKN